MEGFPSALGSPRLVIPAHAGIQVSSAELAWIPAFAGKTEPRRPVRSYPRTGIFEGDHEGHEGFGKYYSELRALRVLRGENISQ